MQKYAAAPFLLLGVNADATVEKLRRMQSQAALTWPSIHDGSNGPVARAWGVDMYPTLVLLDANGNIRWRHVGIPGEALLEGKIDELLREAAAAAFVPAQSVGNVTQAPLPGRQG